MKILSTPTARTRKGMISKMMRVAGTPTNPKIPTEAPTERRTITTPPSPRVILLSIWNEEGEFHQRFYYVLALLSTALALFLHPAIYKEPVHFNESRVSVSRHA